MDLVAHFGAHGDFGSALKELLDRNSDYFQSRGVYAPARNTFAPLIRAAIRENDATRERGRSILSAIEPPSGTTTLLLNNHNFWSSPEAILKHAQLYPDAEAKTAIFFELLSGENNTLIIAIENLATFLARSGSAKLHQAVEATSREDIEALSWFDLIEHVRRVAPSVTLIVIELEKAPALMPEVVQLILPGFNYPILDGAYDYLERSLRWRGRARVRSLVEANGPGQQIDAQTRHEVLSRYGQQSVTEASQYALGIDDALREHLTARYREDCAKIEQISYRRDFDVPDCGLYQIAPRNRIE